MVDLAFIQAGNTEYMNLRSLLVRSPSRYSLHFIFLDHLELYFHFLPPLLLLFVGLFVYSSYLHFLLLDTYTSSLQQLFRKGSFLSTTPNLIGLCPYHLAIYNLLVIRLIRLVLSATIYQVALSQYIQISDTLSMISIPILSRASY